MRRASHFWRRIRHRLILATAALALLSVGGCKPEYNIQEYETTVPEPTVDKVQDGKIKERILGAIVPAGGEGGWWFFKIRGKAEKVAAERSAFNKFLDSVQFENSRENPISWELPAGWTEAPKGKIDFATFRIASKGADLFMTVTFTRGSLLANINRWRVEQVGLEPLTDQQLEEGFQKRMIHGRIVLVLDIAGPGGTPGMKGFPMGKLPAGHPQIEKPKTH